MSIQKAVQRWRRTSGLTYVQIAELVDCSANHARKMGCGCVERVSPALAERFEKASRGVINALELVFPDRAPKRRRGAA